MKKQRSHMRIAICDDIQKDAEILKKLCLQHSQCNDKDITIFPNGNRLLNDYVKNKYDIIFLDVAMPGINGIESGKELRKKDKNVTIIFSTSYPQYALEAFDCQAFHYLVKPLNVDKFTEIFQKAILKYTENNKTYVIDNGKEKHTVKISNIYYIEYKDRYITYFLKDNSYSAKGKMSDVCNEFKDYNFHLVNQATLVNMEKVTDIEGNSIILENQTRLIFSYRKRREFILAYAKYVENHV